MKTPVPHGTYTGYATRGCRCDACRSARLKYLHAYRAANREARVLQDGRWTACLSTAKHGYSAYQGFGCRCEVCTEAKAEADRTQRTRRLRAAPPHPSG